MSGDTEANGETLDPLHPNQIWVLRIRTALAAIPPFLASVFVGLRLPADIAFPAWLVPGAVGVAALAAILFLPIRRYRTWGWRETEDELRLASGLLFRLRTIVPFARVQHIDIAQGPIERRFGIVTLIVHTAGTRGASVPLPGLAQEEAEGLRDRIRARMKKDIG